MWMHAMPMNASASLIGMWVPMMAAMMLPSLVPTLWLYRRSVRARGNGAAVLLTVMMAAGYFLVWTALGLATVPLIAPMSMLRRVAPVIVGVVVLAAGALELSSWKARQLDCCRRDTGHPCARPSSASAAFGSGVHLGLHCCSCCAGVTALLLVSGDMSLRAMTLATAAVTVERLAPRGMDIARLIGAVVLCAGFVLIARAV